MKQLYFLLTFGVFVLTNAFGQAPTIVWDKTLGGSGDDISPTIIATSDGGFVIAGYSLSGISSDKTEANKGDEDYWVVKLNSSGQKIWDKTFGGIGHETKPIISVNNVGEIILGASSNSNISGNKTENAIGGFDIWVMKLSPTGDLIWDKTMGTEDDEYLGGVTIDSDNNIILVASSGAQGYSHTTILIKKMDTIGQILWEREIYKTTYFPKIIRNKNGGYLILACSDGYLVNLDKEGLEKWSININIPLSVNLTQNSLGDIIIIGGFEYSVSKYSFLPILPIINILNNEESVNKGTLLKVNFKAITGNQL